MNDNEKEKLAVLKNGFNLVVSANNQMAKLVPYWGMTAQLGSTYYLQKLSHDVFGITDHSSGTSTVYLFDERIGAKNTDHTVSYLGDFLSKTAPWIRRVHLFLDNASSMNKIFSQWRWPMRWYSSVNLISSEYRFLWLGIPSLPLTCFRSSLSHTIEVTYSVRLRTVPVLHARTASTVDQLCNNQ